jgi:PPE-repeat protein
VFDFGALPPEINSGRMYTGPGSAPMMAAASAWDGLAAELRATASGYSSVIDELTSSPWLGPTSRAMMAAVAPYVSWISAAAAQAEETAGQARAAAAAYEAAFTLTVPPPMIAANRVSLMTLIVTNFFGQNTAAIAATEAQYMEMWAQDAAAMYSYAGSSASATLLTQFADPPNTTTPGAGSDQSTAVSQATATPAGSSAQSIAATIPQLLSSAAAPQAAQAVSTSGASTYLPWPLSLLYDTVSDFLQYGLPTGANNWIGLSPTWFNAILKQTVQAYFGVGVGNFGFSIGQQLFNGPLGSTAGAGGAFIPSPQFGALGAGGWTFAHPSAGLASASLSSSVKVGGLSVPASWANGAPGAADQAVTKVSNLVGSPSAAPGSMNAALTGAPMGARGGQRAGYPGVRYGVRYSVLTRPPSAG